MANNRKSEVVGHENLAAILHTLIAALQLIAAAVRNPQLLDAIERAIAAAERGQRIVIRRRQQLHRDGGDS